MGLLSTQRLPGKFFEKLQTNIIFIMLVCIYLPFHGLAQHNPTHWEFSVQGTVHAPINASLDSGAQRLKFLPCSGLNIRIGYKFAETKKLEYFVYVSRGCTPYWCNIKVYPDQYPQLRSEWETTFYVAQHPYRVLGFYINYDLEERRKFSVFLGNRFYISAGTSLGIEAYDSTLQQIVVFQAVTSTNSKYFCPELNLSYCAPLIKKFPSWNYELMFSFAPVRVVNGAYLFFPEYSEFSLGYFKLNQSYLGIGIKYRRVKKEE